MASVNTSLKLGLASCFNSEDFTDLIIKCGQHQFKVHKVIVCPQSDFLNGLCNSDMKESVEGVIKLDHDDPFVLQAMLHWMYKSTYDDDHGNNPSRCSAIVFNVQVYAIADKYNVSELKDLALASFTAQAEDHWDEAEFTQALRLIHDDDKFPQHDTAMAEAARAQLRVHAGDLMESEEFMSMIDQVGGIASQVLSAMYSDIDSVKNVKKYKCGNCSRIIRMDCVQVKTQGYCYHCGSNLSWANCEQK